MNQLYASAVGTTVLQIREVPFRPAELDGVLCIFGPSEGVDKAAVRLALSCFGEIVAVVDRRLPPIERDEIAVHFTSHQVALDVIAAQPTPLPCNGVGTLYTARPYDPCFAIL